MPAVVLVAVLPFQVTRSLWNFLVPIVLTVRTRPLLAMQPMRRMRMYPPATMVTTVSKSPDESWPDYGEFHFVALV